MTVTRRLQNPLSRKYYIAVAKILKDAREESDGVEYVTRELASYFQTDNSRFDRQRFLNAAGSSRYNPNHHDEEDYSEYLQLAISDSAGIYAPQQFVQAYDVVGASDEDIATVEAGPDEEWYWDAWDAITNNGYVTDGKTKWFIFQSGDVWLVHEDAPEGIYEHLSG